MEIFTAQYANEHRIENMHTVDVFAQYIGRDKKGNAMREVWYECRNCDFKTYKVEDSLEDRTK